MAILPTSSAWNPSVTGEEPRKAERCWRAKCYKPPQAFGPVPHWHHSSGWMGCLSGWWSMETDNLVSLAGRCYNANYLNMYCSSQINSRTTRQKTFWAKKNTVCEHKVSSDGPKFSYEYFKELRFNYSKGSIVSTMSFFSAQCYHLSLCYHFFSTACHTFSLSTQGQNEFQSWIMASNEIIPKWHCEIAGWEKVPLVRQLILFPHLSLICWSHTLSRRSAAAVYICLRCAGWWQGVKSAVWELSDVPVCAPITSTWDTSCFSHLSFLQAAGG